MHDVPAGDIVCDYFSKKSRPAQAQRRYPFVSFFAVFNNHINGIFQDGMALLCVKKAILTVRHLAFWQQYIVP